MKITNLTPRPVTVIRQRPSADGNTQVEHCVEFRACAPQALPRVIDDFVNHTMLLVEDNDDGHGSWGTAQMQDATDLISNVGYVRVENLPAIPPRYVTDGVEHCYIISIDVAIAALASGRPICDLLIPVGQVHDNGKIVGATGLAPAATLLAPLAVRLASRWVLLGSRITKTMEQSPPTPASIDDDRA